MTEPEIALESARLDKLIASKRWVAYPLLIQALKDAIWAFSVMPGSVGKEHYDAIDRAVQLLILLDEKKQLVPSCCNPRT